jgi:molybdenum cofactor cytidylyltransferase
MCLHKEKHHTDRRYPSNLGYSCLMSNSGHHKSSGLWSLILAAGNSSRLKTPKQLLRYRSRFLLSHAISSAEVVTPNQVLVVLGSNALKLRLLLKRHHPDIYSITNTEWEKGMGSSLSVGLSAMPERAKAVLVLVSDQPCVGIKPLNRLVQTWSRRPSHVAAAYYKTNFGVPAILPRKTWDEAKKLTGDIGARQLLRESATPISAVPMPEAIFDVDIQKDAESLKNRTLPHFG